MRESKKGVKQASDEARERKSHSSTLLVDWNARLQDTIPIIHCEKVN